MSNVLHHNIFLDLFRAVNVEELCVFPVIFSSDDT